jgi:N-methylhydantoinase A
MQANGGMMAASVVGEHAVHTVMSGPAGGVLAAAAIAKAAGFRNIITGDMGGTSYDVAVVVNGDPVITAEKDLAYGVPLRIPMIDMNTVGAGGGSIARVDAAGMLRVGPESAGSFPGPIGYGRGGKEPTITDANLLLGRINPTSITGSDAPAPLDEIASILEEKIGRHLSLDAVASAAAILDIAVNELAGAIRLISIEKGHNPRDFALMPFGGAGPVHAVAIARELGIPHVLVPRFPGLTSALGCILADVRHDFVQTVNLPLATLDPKEIDSVFARQVEEGRALLAREKVEVKEVVARHEADLLYRGQSHVIRLPVEGSGFDPKKVVEQFTQHYLDRFGISLAEMSPMLVNVRTTVIGVRERIDLSLFRPQVTTGLGEARTGKRKVYFNEEWIETDIYRRDLLPAGAQFEGPAIVEQMDATLVVDPGVRCRVDDFGNILIEVDGINAAG